MVENSAGNKGGGPVPYILAAHTGVRACAALFVVMFHFTIAAGPAWHGADRIFRVGFLGVDLFFVLSGFIIHHVYATKLDHDLSWSRYIGFLRYRLARIYPVHLATMLAALFASIVLHSESGQKGLNDQAVGVVSAMLLVQGWFNIVSPNFVSWSVSAEWFAYLLYPLIQFKRVAVAPIPAQVAILAALLTALFLGANLNPLLRVIPEFYLGIQAYRVTEHLARHGLKWDLAALGLVVLLLAIDQLTSSESVVLHAVLFAALIIALENKTDFVARALSTKLMIYLGEISYSIYLVHSLVRNLLIHVFRGLQIDPTRPLPVLTSVLASVVVASCAYHFIELPARRALRGPRAGTPQETTLLGAHTKGRQPPPTKDMESSAQPNQDQTDRIGSFERRGPA